MVSILANSFLIVRVSSPGNSCMSSLFDSLQSTCKQVDITCACQDPQSGFHNHHLLSFNHEMSAFFIYTETIFVQIRKAMFSVKCPYKMFYSCRKIVSQNWFREKVFGFSPVSDSISTDRTRSVDNFSMDSSAAWRVPSMNLSDQWLVVRRRHSRLAAPIFKSTSPIDHPLPFTI
jgi:hypothetical protein